MSRGRSSALLVAAAIVVPLIVLGLLVVAGSYALGGFRDNVAQGPQQAGAPAGGAIFEISFASPGRQ